MALTNGVDLITVAAILGHKNTATTLKHYAHYLPNKNITAMQKMGKLFSGDTA